MSDFDLPNNYKVKIILLSNQQYIILLENKWALIMCPAVMQDFIHIPVPQYTTDKTLKYKKHSD